MVERPLRRENFVAAYVKRDAEEQHAHGLHTAEYALVLAVVAFIVVGIMLLTGDQMSREMELIVTAFSAATAGP
jgi:hypothetical protein